MPTPRVFRLAVYFTCLRLLASAAPAPSKPEVIAYVFVKDRVIQPGEIAASELTRINYAFSNIENGKMVEGFAHDCENFAALNALKRKNPDLKILVSVGGWTWSKKFLRRFVNEKQPKGVHRQCHVVFGSVPTGRAGYRLGIPRDDRR